MTDDKQQPTDADIKNAYDAGWHLREMGHTEMLAFQLDKTFKGQPTLRAAFEAGWKSAEEMVEDEQKKGWR